MAIERLLHISPFNHLPCCCRLARSFSRCARCFRCDKYKSNPINNEHRERELEYVCGHDQAEDTDWNREQFSFMTMKIDLGTSFHPPPPRNKHEKQEEDERIRFERIHSVKFAFFGSRKRKRKNGQFSISFSYPHSGFTLCQFHILTPSTTICWRSPTAEQSSFFKFEQNDTTKVAGWGCTVWTRDSRRPTMERRSRTQIANWLFSFFYVVFLTPV